ncbi:hypothetical protein M2160_008945 [Streptomyces sp. SAI-117]|nr:hypothetical protein [Streptomyces sp. SAI-117]MDH6573838.1 hypothetical protein [Streptomyces sp. SAI-117]
MRQRVSWPPLGSRKLAAWVLLPDHALDRRTAVEFGLIYLNTTWLVG